ncbi:MAG: HAD family hydrolase [Clostridia bacterium]
MKYDGIIFDLDGTLWNSTPEIYKSWCETISKHSNLNIPSFEQLMAVMGLSDIELMQTLFPQLTDDEALELFNECSIHENEYLENHAATDYEGIYEVLETLSSKHKLSIVSNCGKGYIEAYMKSMKTGKFITDFECFGNTRQPKFENIKSVIKRNNFKNAVYIGDTVWDMQSAISANIDFVHAAYGFGDFECKFPKILKPIELLNIIGE